MNRERIAELEDAYIMNNPHIVHTVEPYIFDDPEDVLNHDNKMPFPVITDLLLDDNWQETDNEWFVDSSGCGSHSEPALTIPRFRRILYQYIQAHPDHGFGLSGVGQFQVYVRAYKRIS